MQKNIRLRSIPICLAVALASGAFGSHAHAQPVPPFPGGSWFEFGAGVVFDQNHVSGNFFGPGTGSGATLTNNGVMPALEFSAGAFQSFGQSWYGGVVVNVITPMSTSTQSAVTSNGIPVFFHDNRSAAVDVMGRVGAVLPFVTPIRGFLEGGVEFGRNTAIISAPTVADYFVGSNTFTSPVIGGGIDMPLCAPPFVAAGTTCPFSPVLEVEATHTFNNQTWTTGVTPLSSSQGRSEGDTRVGARFKVLFSSIPEGVYIAIPVKPGNN